ncbi:hypothetical protein IKF81_00540 [Candidatus Saccharibacteria bacterium]|nr:hypothetical protein [Candidatus Saccharibacteria bacterium]
MSFIIHQISKNLSFLSRATQYVGDYYNWYAATAESGSYTTTSGNMQDSICPKGWGLPVNGNAQISKSWINLLFTSYSLQDNGDSSTSAHKTPLSLVYSGDYSWVGGNLSNRGLNGYFWSSTPASTAIAQHLHFYSTRLVPQSSLNKIDGFTIRCVVQ